MRITWRGHSFFDIRTANGKRVLIDPFVENGRTRARVADLRDADLVLVTHGHGDHVGSAVEIDRPLVATYELAGILADEGVRETTGMNVGGTVRRGGLRITMTHAQHSSGFHAGDGEPLRYGGVACGYVLDDGLTKFYHAGDTGLFGDMRHVIGDVYKPDVAAVPIGDLFTMGPEHAAIAVEWLGVKAVFPMHYDTFDAIEQDERAWRDRVGRAAKVLLPDVDETIDVAPLVRAAP